MVPVAQKSLALEQVLVKMSSLEAYSELYSYAHDLLSMRHNIPLPALMPSIGSWAALALGWSGQLPLVPHPVHSHQLHNMMP